MNPYDRDDPAATTTRVSPARMSIARIQMMLRADGYRALVPRAAEIQRAARYGALLWTSRRLTTTDGSRIDARPHGASTPEED